eukprot:m.839222 g.839222  ORF g.839222 m.839222 type:complete len:222 (-) comp59503_c0_seq12:3021-3686(-)
MSSMWRNILLPHVNTTAMESIPSAIPSLSLHRHVLIYRSRVRSQTPIHPVRNTIPMQNPFLQTRGATLLACTPPFRPGVILSPCHLCQEKSRFPLARILRVFVQHPHWLRVPAFFRLLMGSLLSNPLKKALWLQAISTSLLSLHLEPPSLSCPCFSTWTRTLKSEPEENLRSFLHVPSNKSQEHGNPDCQQGNKECQEIRAGEARVKFRPAALDGSCFGHN